MVDRWGATGMKRRTLPPDANGELVSESPQRLTGGGVSGVERRALPPDSN
jgi:hypothetical protein